MKKSDYEKLLEAKKRKLEALKFLQVYQQKNRLEYFNSGRALVDGTYLRANPKQQLILDAWDNPALKSFILVGGNRLGKTSIGSIIAISVLFGEWIWNNREIQFPHKEPRKVRAIAQDWESGAKKVMIPELKKWWPETHPYKTKKNSLGVEAFWTDEKTGSTLELMTGQQDSQLHEGWNGDLIW